MNSKRSCNCCCLVHYDTKILGIYILSFDGMEEQFTDRHPQQMCHLCGASYEQLGFYHR